MGQQHTMGLYTSANRAKGVDSGTIGVMAAAAGIGATQPDTALRLFRSLAVQASFPYRDLAREQCAVILWRLGRRSEALQAYRERTCDADVRDPAYERARHVISRLPNVPLCPSDCPDSDEKLARQLEQAERIFERNGDLFMIAKVSRLRAGL